MTTLTNSEGLVINYTNEFLDTILLQLTRGRRLSQKIHKMLKSDK